MLKRRSGPPACKSKRAVTLVINYAFYGSEIERRARADWRETDARAICARRLKSRCRRGEYLDLYRELVSLLGLKPWETSPLNADSEEPPDWLRNNLDQSEYWRKAWAMRCELEAD